MERSLKDESTNLIKGLVAKIISYQVNLSVEILYSELEKFGIQGFEMDGNVVIFDSTQGRRDFDASSPLGVEARVNDVSGNRLHAIVYLDRRGCLLALEVFAWDKWSSSIDINSLKPASFDDQGISNP